MYYKPRNLEKNDAVVMNGLREIYQESPSYGYRRMTVALRERGFTVNHKKVFALQKRAGIQAIYPPKKTTVRNQAHKIFPFTSEAWVAFLKGHTIEISMDGKGRWADNIYVERLWRTIKYEMVYLHSFDTVGEVRAAIARYMTFYNTKRYHSKLNYHTPDAIFAKKLIPSKEELFASFASSPITHQPETIMI